MSSTKYGANLDSIGFNIMFVARRDPQLAEDIMAVYGRARRLDPIAEVQSSSRDHPAVHPW